MSIEDTKKALLAKVDRDGMLDREHAMLLDNRPLIRSFQTAHASRLACATSSVQTWHATGVGPRVGRLLAHDMIAI